MNKKYFIPIIIWIFFATVAVSLWLIFDIIFYLFNFLYIGTCIAIGLFMYLRKNKYARNAVQVAVGLYMLVYLGIIHNENMQIEGFWYFLFLGVFQAAVIHYAVAKIFGPLLFGRGWCGYACWTAIPLDLLPYKKPQNCRKKVKFIPYVLFATSLIFVIILFSAPNIEQIMFWSFIVGNIAYYAVGIALAFILKDNRAFCKYVCPVTVFLRPASYLALLRIKLDKEKCISCNKCIKVCPMDVNMLDNSRKRTNGNECILCMECVDACPKKALHL
ncbi:MAG: 4Fe-4S binding protein [Defluviitaleaceae bacterium]|nr:4Fe-4S binding protein [Defluviitaleaceae bacterium]